MSGAAKRGSTNLRTVPAAPRASLAAPGAAARRMRQILEAWEELAAASERDQSRKVKAAAAVLREARAALADTVDAASTSPARAALLAIEAERAAVDLRRALGRWGRTELDKELGNVLKAQGQAAGRQARQAKREPIRARFRERYAATDPAEPTAARIREARKGWDEHVDGKLPTDRALYGWVGA